MHQYFVILIVMLLLDTLWLTTTKEMYQGLVKAVQRHPLRINMKGAIIAYTLMFLGFVWFVLPFLQNHNKKDNIYKAFRYGFLFGLVVYGIFNATNVAIFSDYSPRVAVFDTLWGASLYFVLAYIVLHIR